MEPISKSKLKNLLKDYEISPSKGLGQNFLVNKQVLKKIITAAELSPKDVVLEVGPGIGNLTSELAKRVKKVIAIEKDQKMVKILRKNLQSFTNLKIIQGDILKIKNRESEIGNSYKVVANLPYYIVSPVIRQFLETKNQPTMMVLMVQKELAQRICAIPPKSNLLAVSVQFYGNPEIVSYVSKKSFWPQPKVDSAIIKIIPRLNNSTPDQLFSQKFFRIVKAGFSHPRKQLLNNLTDNLKLKKEEVISWLLKNKINPKSRAEALSLDGWIHLTKSCKIRQ